MRVGKYVYEIFYVKLCVFCNSSNYVHILRKQYNMLYMFYLRFGTHFFYM